MEQARPLESASTSAFWPTVFFTLLFFLGSADSVFTTRLHQLNFRWGQAALLVAAAVALLSGRAIGLLRSALKEHRGAALAVGAWVLFFAAYAVAALHSSDRRLSLIKLVWALFNIGGAALACLALTKRRQALVEGMVLGYLLIAFVVWIDAIAICWAGLPGPIVGLAQYSYTFAGVTQLRPHAFYYEPSYAGAALAFLLPLTFPIVRDMKPWLRVTIPGFLLATIVLISARTGLLAAPFALAAACGLALLHHGRGVIRPVLTSLAVATVLLTIFFAPTARARGYGAFIAGPLGPVGIVARILGRPFNLSEEYDPRRLREGSERDRMMTMVRNFRAWEKHPWLGSGVEPAPVTDASSVVRKLRPESMDTWLEIGMESGLLGLFTFLAAIGLTLRLAVRATPERQIVPFLIGAWLAHFLLNLNFTQTFPRLDYWLIFFTSVRLLLPDGLPAAAREKAMTG